MSILLSTIAARVIAGNYNFIVNKKIVFKSESNLFYSLVKYWTLVILLGTLSYFGISALVNNSGFNVLVSKVILETLLFFISFTVQRELVFYSNES